MKQARDASSPRYQVCCLTSSCREAKWVRNKHIFNENPWIFMDFHEQEIKEIIDFGVPDHRKSMKLHQMSPKISPRLLGVGTQTWYLGLLASRACFISANQKNHTVSGRAPRLAAERVICIRNWLSLSSENRAQRADINSPAYFYGWFSPDRVWSTCSPNMKG